MQQRTLQTPTSPTSHSSSSSPSSPNSTASTKGADGSPKQHPALPPLITTMPPPSSLRRISVMQLCTPTSTSSVEMNYLMRRRNSIVTPQSSHFSSEIFGTSTACTTPATPKSSGGMKRDLDMIDASPILQKVVSLPIRETDKATRLERSYPAMGRCSEGKTLTMSKAQRARSPIRKRNRPSTPPKYHLTVVPSTTQPLPFHAKPANTVYASVVAHLSTPLVPLVSVANGMPHPQFPSSVLQYQLLTHEQLDSLARWYHQTNTPTDETWKYPAWITPFTSRATAPQPARTQGEYINSSGVDLETKRRRWGRFIGLRGCESPTASSPQAESLVDRMEREWREALRRSQEQERLREKIWRGYF